MEKVCSLEEYEVERREVSERVCGGVYSVGPFHDRFSFIATGALNIFFRNLTAHQAYQALLAIFPTIVFSFLIFRNTYYYSTKYGRKVQ